MPLTLKPSCLWPCCFCAGCWCRLIGRFGPAARLWWDTVRPNAQATNAQLVTSLDALCIQEMTPTACALLEFHWGSSSHPEGFWCCWYRYTHLDFSRFGHSYFVLELVASSDLHSDSAVRHCCQPVCYQLPHYRKMILCLRAACHCIMTQQICAITTSLIVTFLHGSRLLSKPA